jgi:eukaryotic-like serine/threonine-protein kinase
MTRMSEVPVLPGDILAGKYRVERVLGAGNMGVVVAATHVDLGQRVALKFMLPGKAEARERRERFLREARAAVRLKSQHIARVLDVGTLQNEAPYIVMEFLEGQDLAALLKARGPLPFEEAAMYVLQACEGVGEAHAAGVVHRDLKPANLFCTEDIGGSACIKVLDFGISKVEGVDLSLTHETEMLGSPLYMSPEQMHSSKSVDGRSDLWALGVLLYQLVAGRTPFHAETIAHLYSRVLVGAPTPLSAYRSDAPPGFEAVLMRCLERDRERRFPDVAAFAAALVPYAPDHARGYAGRVARAMGIKGAPAALMPEMPPAPRAAAAAELASSETTHTGEAITLPRARAPISSSVGSDTALTLSTSQTTPRAAKAIAAGMLGRALSPSAIAAFSVALGLVALGVGSLWLAQRRSPAPTVAPAAVATRALPEPAAGTAIQASSPTMLGEAHALEPAAAPVPSTTAAAGPAPLASNASQTPRRAASAATPANAKPSLPRAPSTNAARPVTTTTPVTPAAAPPPPKKREGIL